MRNFIYGAFLLTLLFGAGCAAKKASISKNGNENLFSEQYIKKVVTKATEWQLNNPKHHPLDWLNGTFYAGMFSAWETTKSDAIYKSLINWGASEHWQPYKRWFHADDHTIIQTYVDLYRLEKRPEMIEPAIDTLLKFISEPYPARRDFEVIKWWWCDALFMAPPALVKLGITTDNNDLLKASDKYFKESYELLYNKDEKLFARDMRFLADYNGDGPKEENGELIFWSRGNGWVMGGLVRILDELSADYSERPFYENLLKEMSARIVDLQQPDGLWRASLLDPDSYPGGEVSGSGFFCYALAWGINNGVLDRETYLPAVKKAWIALTGCVNEEGRVGWVQPIGANPKRNFSEDSWEVYGTGAFLLAAGEVNKLKL